MSNKKGKRVKEKLLEFQQLIERYTVELYSENTDLFIRRIVITLKKCAAYVLQCFSIR